MIDGVEFGRLVRQRRGIEGMSQKQLAIAAFGNEDRQYQISDLENGKISRPRASTVDAICVALNINVYDLQQHTNIERYYEYGHLCDYLEGGDPQNFPIEITFFPDGEIAIIIEHNFNVRPHAIEYEVRERTLFVASSALSRRSIDAPISDATHSALAAGARVVIVIATETPFSGRQLIDMIGFQPKLVR